MKPFEYFIETGEVKEVSKNPALARSLIKDLLDRTKDIKLLDISKFSKIVFENIYDALRDFADAILAIDGYKSYSHQASFAYLLRYNFDEPSLDLLDKFRYKRNGSKYYGERISKEEAEEIFNFYEKIEQRIKEIAKKRGVLWT